MSWLKRTGLSKNLPNSKSLEAKEQIAENKLRQTQQDIARTQPILNKARELQRRTPDHFTEDLTRTIEGQWKS